MKRLLSLIGAMSLTVAPVATVIACGDVFGGFDELIAVNDDVTERNFGNFDHTPTDDELLDQAVQLNEHLNISQVHIESNRNGEARLIVNDDSDIYEAGGVVIIYYTDPDDPLIRLGAVVTTINLGDFDHSPSSQELLDRARELNPDLHLDEVTITNRTNREASITANLNSEVYRQGSVRIRYSDPLDLINLDEVVIRQALGEFANRPTEQELLDRIAERNPDLQLDQVQVAAITEDQGFIMTVDESQIYEQGRLRTTYQISSNLSSVQNDVPQTDMGRFESYPSDEEIMQRIVERNPNLRQDEVHLENSNLQGTTLTVNEGSSIYREGSMRITYTVNLRVLENEFTTTDLGEFETFPSEQQILERAHELNSDITIEELHVDDAQLEDASIHVNENSHVYEQTTINVTYVVHLRPLSGDVEITDLGSFDAVPTSDEIVARLAELNEHVTPEDIQANDIHTNDAVVVVRESSRAYEQGGRVEVTYTIASQVTLASVINNTNLGNFDSFPTEGAFLRRVKELNDDVQVDEIQINTDYQGQVHIGALRNSLVYTPEEVVVYYTYTNNQRIYITEVISETHLGSFENLPTIAELLGRVRDLNPTLNTDEIDVLFNTDNQMEIRPKTDSNVYYWYEQISVIFDYSVQNESDRTVLSSVITNTRLGEVDWTEQALMNGLVSANSNLDRNQVRISTIGLGWAVVSVNANSTVYEQTSMLFWYHIRSDNKRTLGNELATRNLGDLYIQGRIATADEVMGEVLRINNVGNRRVMRYEIEITGITSSGATVRVNTDDPLLYRTGNNNSRASVNVTFNPIQIDTVESVVRRTNLGNFGNINPTSQQILDRLEATNSNIDISQVRVSANDGRNGRATIIALPRSQVYSGSITVTFTTN